MQDENVLQGLSVIIRNVAGTATLFGPSYQPPKNVSVGSLSIIRTECWSLLEPVIPYQEQHWWLLRLLQQTVTQTQFLRCAARKVLMAGKARNLGYLL